jgi:hypothetical protein
MLHFSRHGFNGTVALSRWARRSLRRLPQIMKVNCYLDALVGMLIPRRTRLGTYTITFTGRLSNADQLGDRHREGR